MCLALLRTIAGANWALCKGEETMSVLLRPTLVIRAIEIVSGIIVFACIVNQCQPEDSCIFSPDNTSHCKYGVAVGVLAFVFGLIFFTTEILSVTSMKAAPVGLLYLIDALISAALSILSFVAFCLLANDWRTRDDSYSWEDARINAAQSALAFLFFSIFLWATSCALAFRERARQHTPAAGPAQSSVDAQYASFVEH
eukprot:m.233600 g.233600  ORF g.233600 m.233600 type:complete len:198 (+) comp12540_c0_seq1:18-611(+)